MRLEQELSNVLDRIHREGPIHQSDMEFLALTKKEYPELFETIESTLIYLLGLFYKLNEPENLLEFAYQYIAKDIQNNTGEKFTPIQADAYSEIHENIYFSFSAPTSAGKSFLFKKLIEDIEGDVVVVLPSRALINEYLQRINQIFQDSNEVLILPFIENVNTRNTKKRIYVITPERGDELFAIYQSLNIKLFLFDEAQISEEEVRGLKFDAFVRRVNNILPEAKKVFAHPFIDNPQGQLEKHNFLSFSDAKNYEQNSVGKIFIGHFDDGHYEYFSPFGTNLENFTLPHDYDPIKEILLRNGTVLIYTSKQQIYDGAHLSRFSEYVGLCNSITDPAGIKILQELGEYIGVSKDDVGRSSFMLSMMELGIVIHHGSMPLKMRFLVEQFINSGFAKICFATGTLIQGINMPFDCVWIDNFTFQGGDNKARLDIKNLIGRAGRTSRAEGVFDFGTVIINKKNIRTFSDRISSSTHISTVSVLDSNDDDETSDDFDLIEGIRLNSIDPIIKLPQSQINRITNSGLDEGIALILNSLLPNGEPITASEYYTILDSVRTDIKSAFKDIYLSHLRRNQLTTGEQAVLSTAIPILLWQIQGKSFKEIIGLRYSFLTRKKEIKAMKNRMARGEINIFELTSFLESIRVRPTPEAKSLPNRELKSIAWLFRNTEIEDFDYDMLVYDTYDYLDKVIAQSISIPISAAFHIYYNKTGDMRAEAICNYLRFGTNDSVEIWLLKYGFSFEEIEWVKPLIQSINSEEILFNENIALINTEERLRLSKYL